VNALVLLGFLVAAWVVTQTVLLQKAMRPPEGSRVKLGRAALVVVARLVATLAIWFVLSNRFDDVAEPFGLLAVVVAVDMTFTLLLILWSAGRPIGERSRRLLSQFAGGLAATLLLFGVAGTCLGTNSIPNSSMSPNIRGYHVVEPLPDGTHLVVAANTPGDWGIPPGEPGGAIVAETYEYRVVPRPEQYTQPADRFLWNKTRRPERWDAVVFSYPDRPGDLFCKRLVGLPGEQVDIHDGAVWVNGERLTPPARLGPIRHTSSPLRDLMGTSTLGSDECFLLGDNTDHCSDCRVHGPVPWENIRGVVEAIYWPPARWRLNP
jgi:signal peptidase I